MTPARKRPVPAADRLPQNGWTVEESHRAAATRSFPPAERLELVQGRIAGTTPPNTWHAGHIPHGGEVLRRAFRPGFHVRGEKPLVIAADRQPQPDLAVHCAPSLDDVARVPEAGGVDLIEEAADASLSSDRTRKAALCAEAGVADYWVPSQRDHRLEVHRDPGDGMPGQRGCRSITRCTRGMCVSPRTRSGVAIPITDPLPEGAQPPSQGGPAPPRAEPSIPCHG